MTKKAGAVPAYAGDSPVAGNTPVDSNQLSAERAQRLGMPDLYVRLVRNGVRLDPLSDTAVEAYERPQGNYSSVTEQLEVVAAELDRVLEKGKVEYCDTRPKVVNPLGCVRKPDGVSWRIVLDTSISGLNATLRYLDQHEFANGSRGRANAATRLLDGQV